MTGVKVDEHEKAIGFAIEERGQAGFSANFSNVDVPDVFIDEHDDVETASQLGNIPFIIRG
ncbi:hypothetical protein OROMI_007440 [Orobanche minor]